MDNIQVTFKTTFGPIFVVTTIFLILVFPRSKQRFSMNVVQRKVHISKPLFSIDQSTEATQIFIFSYTGSEVVHF